MIYAIGTVGARVRMFMTSQSRDRVQQQLGADEVAFVVPDETRGIIRHDGVDEYRVEPVVEE